MKTLKHRNKAKYSMHKPADNHNLTAVRPGAFATLLMCLGVLSLAACASLSSDNLPASTGMSIYYSTQGSRLEVLAAREVRRYVYVRTGHLLPLVETANLPTGATGIVIGRKDRSVLPSVAAADLAAQAYQIETVPGHGRPLVVIAGGDDAGTLYGAYRFAEILGVRFYLEGDVIPDEKIALAFPEVHEKAAPLFALRGIQPFHDFPEGPDWWSRENYKVILSQLPKLRMNFFGLHTYPEGQPNAEPTTWIGLAQDINLDGTVKFAYPSHYNNTLQPGWGYKPRKTGEYSLGTGALFAEDGYGGPLMEGFCPQPRTPKECQELFNRTGTLLNDAFTHARALGIKTCLGTETTLTIPAAVKDHLKSLGKNPASLEVRREVYEGIFTRIMKAYPIDYYWFWTPEWWTWQETKPSSVDAVAQDMDAAVAAARKVHAPFTLATCGWVLGPQYDRSLFDRHLPREMPMSCIGRQFGNDPVEPGFAQIKDRPKWAIPWMEDDPGLTQPQLWAGRMRRDAADALDYGCTGLMGIHWRTRVLGPNVAALAQAAWQQDTWRSKRPTQAGFIGGEVSTFPGAVIADTTDQPLYRTVRYNMRSYRVTAPNGRYKVTLRFCEPYYDKPETRVFGVNLQGRRVIDKLDLFARAGKNRALDYVFDDVEVATGRMDIDFVPQTEYPCIAAIAIEGKNFLHKVNAGGPAYKDYTADEARQKQYVPVEDFYADWALANFGREAAGPIGVLFARLDGHLPRPANWVSGPGNLYLTERDWSKLAPQYAFVDELASLRPLVRGVGNLERFDYWINTMQYLRAMARAACLDAAQKAALEVMRKAPDEAARRKVAQEEALPLHKQLVSAAAEAYRHLIPTISTTGEMGTLDNWQRHIEPDSLIEPAAEIARALGTPLPADAELPKVYRGPSRLVVPALPNTLNAGETLTLVARVLSAATTNQVTIYWRPLGTKMFTAVPLKHVNRGVYRLTLPAEASQEDMEYYVELTTATGERACVPATGAQMPQTVTIAPPFSN